MSNKSIVDYNHCAAISNGNTINICITVLNVENGIMNYTKMNIHLVYQIDSHLF